MKKPKIEPNIQCTYCKYKWHTKSKRKHLTCPSCNSKTLNPLWITANDIKLYRIWSFDYNDRREIARAIARDFETVQDYLLNEFIKPEFREDIELTDYGLEWDETPDLETALQEGYVKNEEEYEEYMQYGEADIRGFQIEEIEQPSGLYWGEEFHFKTIFGTNDFYDLTGKRHTKAKDTDTGLRQAWKKSPEFDILGVKIRLDKGFYSVRLGNTTKGYYAMTPQLRAKTVKTLQDMIKELLSVSGSNRT